jgi:hypothetical protein
VNLWWIAGTCTAMAVEAVLAWHCWRHDRYVRQPPVQDHDIIPWNLPADRSTR